MVMHSENQANKSGNINMDLYYHKAKLLHTRYMIFSSFLTSLFSCVFATSFFFTFFFYLILVYMFSCS